MSIRHSDPRVQAVIDFFEQLQPADVAGLGRLYTDQAFFKDPFNEVRSLAGVQQVFAHMFETLEQPRFLVLDALAQGDQCFLSWDFVFLRQAQKEPIRIHGSSHLRFAVDGRVAYHRDYWDTAEELYEKLPLLGALMRWIKRRLRAS
jgi:steroid delta-isomerase